MTRSNSRAASRYEATGGRWWMNGSCCSGGDAAAAARATAASHARPLSPRAAPRPASCDCLPAGDEWDEVFENPLSVEAMPARASSRPLPTTCVGVDADEWAEAPALPALELSRPLSGVSSRLRPEDARADASDAGSGQWRLNNRWASLEEEPAIHGTAVVSDATVACEGAAAGVGGELDSVATRVAIAATDAAIDAGFLLGLGGSEEWPAEETLLVPPRLGLRASPGAAAYAPASSLRAHAVISSTTAQKSDILSWSVFERSLGRANAAAISESPLLAKLQMVTAEDTLAGDVYDTGQDGSCGFTVIVHRSPYSRAVQDFGMCHHFTWDGKHCVGTGLGSEHGNRCAGRLCIVGGIADLQICKAVGSTACSKFGDVDLVEAACGRSVGGVCSTESCPFLAEGIPCPYGTSLLGKDGLFHL